MKRMILSVVAGAVLLGGAASALAENPDCHLEGINRDLDSVIAQIQSSPANGHAGGQYAKAIQDLQRVKQQVAAGCRDWNGGAMHRR